MIEELQAALAVAKKELQIARRYPLNLVNEVLQPLYQFLLPSLLLGLTFYVGGRAIGLEATTGTDDLAGYLFLGTVVGGLVGAAFWDMAFGLKREMDAGTLEPTWLTPTRPDTAVLGRAFSGMVLSAVASVILVAIGALIFGAELAAGIVVGLPAMILASISMIGIGYLVASAVLMIREPNFMVDSTNFIFAMLSGVAFPITVLPLVIQPFCYLLPTTYAVDLLRFYALGTIPLLPPPVMWLALMVLAVVYIVVGRWVFLRTEHRMRVLGTTGQH